VIANAGDVTISAGVFAAIIGVALTGLISLVAYLFRQIARSNTALARTAAELQAIDKRVERLEDRIFPVVDVGRGSQRRTP
jgi:hypothetical protein